MNIDGEVLKKLNIRRYSIERGFFSRRNSVCLVRGRRRGRDAVFIYKAYDAGDIEKESAYLSLLKGRNVPEILARGKDALCLEYIKGSTLLECLEESEAKGEPFTAHTDALIRFLGTYYTAMPGHIYGDINLRNFIVTERGVYGVDLEDAWLGSKETDIGRLAAYILTYDPAGTDYKKSAADYLIKASAIAFGLHRNAVEREKQRELEAMSARRETAGEKDVCC